MKFVFFDLETTGLNKDDEVIEIGAIKVVDFEVVSTFKTLVRPRKLLPRFITNLTGITQEELDKAQDREKIKEDFKKFIEDAVLVAHNASFDKEFLERFLEERVQNEVIDSLELARLIYPEFSSHSLEKLVATLNIKREKAHRAFNDALMLYEVFKKILEESKSFSNKDMKLIHEIIGNSRNFEFLFGDFENVEKGTLNLKEFDAPTLTLPFREKSSKTKPGVFYIENSSLEDIAKLISNGGKSLVVVYSENVIDKIKDNLKEGKTFDATELENFICIDRLNYYIDNPDKIPDELRIDFAILASYLMKTHDFTLSSAPTHILKNKIVKNLSICKNNGCSFKSVCPLMQKKNEIENSDFVFMKYSNFFNSLKILSDFNFDSIVFLEAYRIPKVFLSLKANFSRNDVEMIANFEEETKKQDILTLFDNFENLSKESRNELFSSITNYDVLDLSENIYRNGNDSVSLNFSYPVRVFSKVPNIASSINFISNYFTLKGDNPIERFTGLRGQIEKKEEDSKVMSIIPLFMHAPNADEFLREFFDLYEPFSQIKPVLFVFENRIQLNTVKMELKNKYQWIEESLSKEDGTVDFITYEFPVKNKFKLIFVVKLPMNIINADETYAMYYLKNFVKDNLQKEKSSVFYFDGRLKDKNFIVKYEDAFLSTPMLLEKKENLIQFVKKYIST
ncbi:MAG: 3'-5' exonuclease [Caldisericum sp.]|jgi:DNA polymerase-3 subunit alpha (Gram-positive type)|nr:3'-5' exonuclease [Caldisericum sp.]